MELLITDAAGIYIPEEFAEEFGHNLEKGIMKGIDQEDLDYLKKGPDQEHYWDVWQTVLDNAEFIDNGIKKTLYQDGDLFLMEEKDWENKEFFGEDN